MTAVLFSVATFFSTFFGGLFALRHNDRLHYILSFTAGVLLGVVSFDILPEIFRLAQTHGYDPARAMIALVFGFLLFHSAEKLVLIHHAHEDGYTPHHHPQVGFLSALALSGHSFMDGVGIGIAFQVSAQVGVIVAIAVIAHDFCDGLNTVVLMLVHKNDRRRALKMLALDAIAPVFGAASTLLFRLPPQGLMLFLGFFSGFLLYIGAADILPEAHSKAPPAIVLRLVGLTCLGAAFIFTVVHIAG
ncbi:MAG: ZIP family metal transporter [Alphaproteobacteria bacterium]|nr:ZIP family metal transporter [Alphaproteobacteria bacterium]MDE2337162.1 ZIP family metal transporter [Alphaproteobacteria bacterium]